MKDLFLSFCSLWRKECTVSSYPPSPLIMVAWLCQALAALFSAGCIAACEFLPCTQALLSTRVIATAVGILEFALTEIAENPTLMVTLMSTQLLYAYLEHQEVLFNPCRDMQCCSCIALYIRAY